MQEVREAAGIEIYTVYLQVREDILWGRISDRLKEQPERKKYDEDKREWMDKTVQFYETFNEWDLVVENNNLNTAEVMREIIGKLALRSQRLRDTMQGANSPGKEYFRKNLGVENVLATIHSPSQSTEKEDREADLEAAALASKEHSLPVVDAKGASEASFRRTSP